MLENPNSPIIPKEYNYKQWRNHYYYIYHFKSESAGKTESPVMAYDMKRLNKIYKEVTGQLSPIKGSHEHFIDQSRKEIAHQEITEIAGHSRISIFGSYIG